MAQIAKKNAKQRPGITRQRKTPDHRFQKKRSKAGRARPLAEPPPLRTASSDDGDRLTQLNRCLELALNNMARGLSMFDANQRLIVCNKTYEEIYELPERLTRPGTSLADLVRNHVKRETGLDNPKEWKK